MNILVLIIIIDINVLLLLFGNWTYYFLVQAWFWEGRMCEKLVQLIIPIRQHFWKKDEVEKMQTNL